MENTELKPSDVISTLLDTASKANNKEIQSQTAVERLFSKLIEDFERTLREDILNNRPAEVIKARMAEFKSLQVTPANIDKTLPENLALNSADVEKVEARFEVMEASINEMIKERDGIEKEDLNPQKQQENDLEI